MELRLIKDGKEGAELVRIDGGNDGELVMDDQDAIIISLPTGPLGTNQLVGVEVKAGKLIVTCFQPVKIKRKYQAKKEVQRKSEAGHEKG